METSAVRERFAEVCLRLPGASRLDRGAHSQFLRGKRTFAYFLDDHHGDGIAGCTVKVGWGENEDLVGTDPHRYYLPAYLAARGWVGIRLDMETSDWEELAGLVEESYRLVLGRRDTR